MQRYAKGKKSRARQHASIKNKEKTNNNAKEGHKSFSGRRRKRGAADEKKKSQSIQTRFIRKVAFRERNQH